MNFIEKESAQKLRGGFYTEPAIASFLVKWIKASKPSTVLEPSCGDGVFLEAIEQHCIPSLKQVFACELNGEEVKKATSRTRLPLSVKHADFLHWYLFESENAHFDAVVGNPPFIRYQYLPDEQQILSEKIFTQLGLPFTKHTNAWVPFVLASVKLLRAGGRIAMVVPSEIFHIPHAQSLRRYLTEECSRILVLDPEQIWFSGTLQGTVLLLAEKKRSRSETSNGVAVVSVKNRTVLDSSPERHFQRASYTNGVTIEGKWMPVFLSPGERTLLSELRRHEQVKTFSELASVDVGIVTGANKFFLVPDGTVDAFGLHQYAHPMFGRSDHVQGLVYSGRDHAANKANGLPANFLWFQEEDIDKLPARVKAYLKIGLEEKLEVRFKCRTRNPWYKVPSVYAAPIAMLKRAHDYPRLVLNRANAYTTDTAYRIRPLRIKPESLVVGFLNSLTCLTAELEGRHYGGGVLELVPSEIERLLIPSVIATMEELNSADHGFRKMRSAVEFLRKNDAFVFSRMGLTRSDRESLYGGWLRLRDRRQRNSALGLDSGS